MPNAIIGREFASWVGPIVEKKASFCLISDFCHAGGFGREIQQYETKSPERWQGGAALLYACHVDEVTVEKHFPEGSPDAKSHGLFTFSLCQILRTGQAMTYTQLADRIRKKYIADGRMFPTPSVSGKNRFRFILENQEAVEQSEMVLFSDGFGGLKVSAGACADCVLARFLRLLRAGTGPRAPASSGTFA